MEERRIPWVSRIICEAQISDFPSGRDLEEQNIEVHMSFQKGLTLNYHVLSNLEWSCQNQLLLIWHLLRLRNVDWLSFTMSDELLYRRSPQKIFQL